MGTYIAYFDYLGFKEFILNNDSAELKRRADHLLRDVESAITQGKERIKRNGYIFANLDEMEVNCLTISDTVIFWSRDDSPESRRLILSAAFEFNWKNLFFNMPARGVVCFDELDIIHGNHVNPNGLIYSPNLIYGKGLVNAHVKAENQSWAGCVVDQSVLNAIAAEGKDPALELEPYAKLYNVPYKDGSVQPEYAMKLFSGEEYNKAHFDNDCDNIRARFSGDNKPVTSPRVQEILNNTIDYLATFNTK